MDIGDSLPSKLGLNQHGEEVKAADFVGSKLVLYFYPKDNTPGCTAQACSFRDNYQAMLSQGYKILGVSVDDQKSHLKFIDKQNLPFDLIADTDKYLVTLFGVWGEKKLAGRTYMGVYRSTFIFDENGCLIEMYTPKQIKTKEHAQQILSK